MILLPIIFLVYYIINCIVYFRTFNFSFEMWLRSEHVSRRLRGRLYISGVSGSKTSTGRVQAASARKVPFISSSNHRINTLRKCSRLTRWRHRSPNFLKEVSMKLLYKILI